MPNTIDNKYWEYQVFKDCEDSPYMQKKNIISYNFIDTGRYYTGIGSRKTPPGILIYISELASKLRDTLTLRSGHAIGADSAFESGAAGTAYIYLPYNNFNGKSIVHGSPIIFDQLGSAHRNKLEAEMIKLYGSYNWGKRVHQDYIRKLLVRNVMQILGHKPYKWIQSEFVIYWAPPLKDGNVRGGTNYAIQLAKAYDIPTFNLYHTSEEVEDFISNL